MGPGEGQPPKPRPLSPPRDRTKHRKPKRGLVALMDVLVRSDYKLARYTHHVNHLSPLLVSLHVTMLWIHHGVLNDEKPCNHDPVFGCN